MNKEKDAISKQKVANDDCQGLNKLLNSAANNVGNELVEQKSEKPILQKKEKSKEQELQEILDAMGEALTANSGGISDKFGWMVYDQLSKSCYKDTNILEAVKHIFCAHIPPLCNIKNNLQLNHRDGCEFCTC